MTKSSEISPCSKMGILLLCCHAATDMALGFVFLHELPNLGKEGRGDPGQDLTQILVDCGFGNPEFLSGGADGAAAFDHVHSQSAGAVVFVVCHRNNLLSCVVTIQPMCRLGGYSIDERGGIHYNGNVYSYETFPEVYYGILYE